MALKQLNETLATELIENGLAGIGVHNLSPGAPRHALHGHGRTGSADQGLRSQHAGLIS
jgi:hypothetical protein